jgi:hypothetical protein
MRDSETLSVNEAMEKQENSAKRNAGCVKQIRKGVKTLRTKSVIDDLIRRGITPDRIERTIKDVEVAADVMTNKAKSRIAHRKRAKLKVVKS